MTEYINKIFNQDVLEGIDSIPNDALDLIVADPPYCLGKDYGNNSDKLSPEEYLKWMQRWIDAVIPKLKDTGSLYIFFDMEI